MDQSTGTNNLGGYKQTIPLNLNDGPVHRFSQMMLWGSIQWVKVPVKLDILTLSLSSLAFDLDGTNCDHYTTFCIDLRLFYTCNCLDRQLLKLSTARPTAIRVMFPSWFQRRDFPSQKFVGRTRGIKCPHTPTNRPLLTV